MCGRFALTLPNEAMVRLFNARPANDLPPVPRYNICPTTPIHTVRSAEDGRWLAPMRWGFIPHWYKSPDDGPLIINARAESLATRPAFREAARKRRCLIPASGFYEWEKAPDGKRLPWYIVPAEGEVMAFAGIWQDWTDPESGERLRTCAIVTTDAGPDIAHIHNRMPVIIAPDDWALWLGEAGKGAALLMRPAPAGSLRAWRVSRRVNARTAEGPELIEPLEPAS
ncbi:MAG: SOS response-associated peptidase [Alphaproteobacteria bacterium]|nr:MAG: SOS response-associated peptidase [Alphaproteobacteria bacterium]